jgi:RNA polymerase sigma factor for flagellar operon FliA
MEQIPLVRDIARRIRRTLPNHVPFEDLLQSGIVGLLDAVAKYDPDRQVPFQAYASFRVRGAILDSLRELDWGPRDLRRKARHLEKARSTLRSRLGRNPNEQELAAQLGIRLSALQLLVGGIANLKMENLRSDPNGQEKDLCDCTPARLEEMPLPLCLRSETTRVLTRAIAELPLRQRKVMVLYYGKELTMKGVASVLGICESRVSQLHSMAVVALRIWFSERTSRQAHSVGVTVMSDVRGPKPSVSVK